MGRKIGIGLTGAGLLFMVLGMMMIIGMNKTFRFFFQKRKLKGTACFLGGIGLVLLGWPVIGMGVEGFGFLNLSGGFFPIALGFLRNMPVVGSLLNLPIIRSVTDRFVQKARLPV